MNTAPQITWKHLTPNPNSTYRQLFVHGTRIRAEVLYGLTVDGSEPLSPMEVAESYQLPLEAVQEAIAYCQSNPREIAEDHRREQETAKLTGMDSPEGKYKMVSPQERARLGL